jgi:hypothetical protein
VLDEELDLLEGNLPRSDRSLRVETDRGGHRRDAGEPDQPMDPA